VLATGLEVDGIGTNIPVVKTVPTFSRADGDLYHEGSVLGR
jgi:hypothetical protein